VLKQGTMQWDGKANMLHRNKMTAIQFMSQLGSPSWVSES
jgi:hypothetical protein